MTCSPGHWGALGGFARELDCFEEHAGGIPRHARHELSAGLEETLKLRGFPGECVVPLVFIAASRSPSKHRQPHELKIRDLEMGPSHDGLNCLAIDDKLTSKSPQSRNVLRIHQEDANYY